MKSLVLFFIPFIGVPAIAQTAPLREEIVVTASALPERVEESPASVTVITREEIEDRGARDVADVLREVPGLIVARIGSSGHQTSIFTRGGNPAHTLVLWNGVEINTPFFGGYDWGQFSTAGVEQIEVVRGPYSALYGSDAMAGVINILTVPQGSQFVATLTSGGNDLRNGQMVASRSGESGSISGSLESRTDSGFAPNDDFDQQTANVALAWKASPQLSFGLRGRFMSFDLGIPTNLSASLTELVASPRRRQDGHEQQLAIPIEQKLGRFEWELLLAEHRREDRFDDPDDPFGLLFQETDSVMRRARLTTRMRTAIGTLIAGGEHESTTVDDVTNFGPNFVDKKRREQSLFVEDRYSHVFASSARLEVTAGVRHDSYQTFGSQTSPRIAAGWMKGRTKLRAAYGEAFRAPSIGEMYSPFGGNPDLRAERSRSIEAGVDYYLDRGALSITLFRDQYRDLITNAGFVLANVGRARMSGVELAAEGRFGDWISAGATYTLLEAEQLDSGAPLLRRPRHSGSAFVSLRRGAVETTLVALRSGVREDILPVLPFSRVTNGGQMTLDANLQLHLERFTPFLKIENATDADYQEVLGYPAPGRRAIVGVRFGI